MSRELNSEIGRTMARLRHAKTDEDRAILRKRLSELARKRMICRKVAGTEKEMHEIEDLYAEESLIVGGYSPYED